MKRAINILAIVYLVILAVQFAAGEVRVAALRQAQSPGWSSIDSPVLIAVGCIGLVAMIGTWCGAVYYWSTVRDKSIGHWVMLFVLVPLGILVGPFYVLYRALKERQATLLLGGEGVKQRGGL
jgi:cytochrome c oxidase assembly factor CtaG